MRLPTRPVAALLLLCYGTACTSWKLQSVTPEQTFSDSSYVARGVRVTTRDRRRVEIRKPSLERDTIAGLDRRGSPVRVSLQEIGSLEVKRPDAGETVTLVVATAVGAFAAFVLVSCAVYCED